MHVLGLSGGLDQVYEHREHLFQPGICHDAAAVLVEDGRVVAAIEEERLNRIKHTSKGAVNAIAWCLRERNLRISDLDYLIYYGTETGVETWMRNLFYGSKNAEPVSTYRQLIHAMLTQGLGEDLDDDKLGFVHHHLAHAISCVAQSGFDECLLLTIDGAGDGLCGTVSHWRGHQYNVLQTYPESASLGNFYDRIIQMIGYGFTEEYKVMGLAPYGDPLRFKPAFDTLYTLLANGNYVIHWHAIESLYSLLPLRKKKDPILQQHKDLAAALQNALECIVFHILTYFRARSGISTLCLAGGVAHNSTLNGRILSSGLFSEVFVQPSSGDSGCAIGAAYLPFMQPDAVAQCQSRPRIEHVFWGSDVGSDEQIEQALNRWKPCVSFEHRTDIARHGAELLAKGEVLGWVQGKSEFGPRALGHRSILADPRPESNKQQINAIVKKREGFRPFAPAVLEERAAEFFDMPGAVTTTPFMSYTLMVRPQVRHQLGAVTHVDGTARVQTVSRTVDPLFWDLIDAFAEQTGIPVLLNTSFNNHAEPIVDSIDDAVACFLTTGLHGLIVGNMAVRKLREGAEAARALSPSLASYSTMNESHRTGLTGSREVLHTIANTYDNDSHAISPDVYRLLRETDENHDVETLCGHLALDPAEMAKQLTALWELRVIVMRPPVSRQS